MRSSVIEHAPNLQGNTRRSHARGPDLLASWTWANRAAQCNADDLRLHRRNAGVAAGLISQIMDAHMIEMVWRQKDCSAAEQIGALKICS